MLEKKSIVSERLLIRHETQCNVKSGVFYCLKNIIIYIYIYVCVCVCVCVYVCVCMYNMYMVAAPLILGGDLKFSDQNNSGGPKQKNKFWGELNLRGDLKM